jgi:hypothetical protein
LEKELTNEVGEVSLSRQDEIAEYIKTISEKLIDIDAGSETMFKSLQIDDEQLHACFSL